MSPFLFKSKSHKNTKKKTIIGIGCTNCLEVSLTRATKDDETTLITKTLLLLGLMIAFFMEVESVVNFS
jgi:hypothetical protein